MADGEETILQILGQRMAVAMAQQKDADMEALFSWQSVRQLTRWERFKHKVSRSWRIWV